MSHARRRGGGRSGAAGGACDRGPLPIGEALDDVVAGLARVDPGSPGRARSAVGGPGARAAAVVGTVFSRWEELVGSSVARHTRPVRLAGGTLVVAVDQPAWATQLRVLAPGILERLTERTGEVIDQLEVVVRVDH